MPTRSQQLELRYDRFQPFERQIQHVFVEASAFDGSPKHEADSEIDQLIAYP